MFPVFSKQHCNQYAESQAFVKVKKTLMFMNVFQKEKNDPIQFLVLRGQLTVWLCLLVSLVL